MMLNFDEAKAMVFKFLDEASPGYKEIQDWHELRAWELPDSFVFAAGEQSEASSYEEGYYQVLKEEPDPRFPLSPILMEAGDTVPGRTEKIEDLLANARRIV